MCYSWVSKSALSCMCVHTSLQQCDRWPFIFYMHDMEQSDRDTHQRNGAQETSELRPSSFPSFQTNYVWWINRYVWRDILHLKFLHAISTHLLFIAQKLQEKLIGWFPLMPSYTNFQSMCIETIQKQKQKNNQQVLVVFFIHDPSSVSGDGSGRSWLE